MIKKEDKPEFIGQIMDLFGISWMNTGLKFLKKKERKAMIRILR